jgi:Peptidase family M23
VVLVPALLVAIGITFLVLSVVPIYGSQPPPAGEPQSFTALSDEQLGEVSEIRPQNAAAAPNQKPPGRATTSVTAPQLVTVQHSTAPVRQPVPLDALPVTSAQPVSGNTRVSPSTKPVQDNGPLEVVIVSHLADDALVRLLEEGLQREGGLSVQEADISSLGRPDILLILDQSTTGSSVWFCGPTPNESSLLANAVLTNVRDLPPEPDDALGDAVDRSLGCSTLLAGRARMAALDLRLPVGEVPPEAMVPLLTAGVREYLADGEARIRQNRNSNLVVWPAVGPITSHYGPSHPLGIDIGQSTGDIVAATDGTVSFAGGDPCCSYGLYVVIESPNGITTLYGHLSEIYVKEGQTVSAGQPLGQVGSTGHSTGPHLHFETLVDGNRVNPLSLLP